MERYDCTLWEFLKETDKYIISLSERLSLISEIMEVVIFIQSEGMCHRDIKPSNILLKTEKISSFKRGGSTGKRQLLNQIFKIRKNGWALTDFGLSCKVSVGKNTTQT